jgi:short-subunit dehydrogenase involved in D-alanine esterification of teichoic acids
MKLEIKIIFITGATKGIDLELAKQLLAKNNLPKISSKST